jgi:nucleoside-diphosphate-sugar epimerase
MYVHVTGAGGSLGTALAPALADEHELRLSDVEELETDHEFVKADVRDPDQIREAAQGVDAIIHTPAWHGVHTDERTEREFWELNVDGTFNTFEAAVANDVSKVVFVSSQAALAGVGGKYAFTKLVGETVGEYFATNHDLSAISVRPAAFAVHTGNRKPYGERLLRNAVDRRDVVGITRAALENDTIEWGTYPAVRDDPYTEAELEQWTEDPIGVLENYVADAGRLVEKYDLDLPEEINPNGGFQQTTMDATREDLGYEANYTFVRFLEGLKEHDEQGDAEAWLSGES